jgi:hypothetical protein
MWLPTKKQVDTATRYAGVAVGTAFTIFGLQNKGFDLQKVMGLITQLGDTVNTVVPTISAIYAFYLATRGVIAASPTNQIGAVTDIASNPQNAQSDSAKVALLNATATIVANPAGATGAVLDVSQVTKAALLDATAAIPEVVEPIRVTDQSLVDATKSEQVVKTGGMEN